MPTFIGLVAAFLLGWLFGPWFADRYLNGHRDDAGGQFIVGIIAFCVVSILVQTCAPLYRTRSPGMSIWKTTPGRKAVGFLAGLVVRFLAVGYATVSVIVLASWYVAPTNAALEIIAAVIVGLMVLAPPGHVAAVKFYIAFALALPRRWQRERYRDRGGSARFAGLLDEWLYPWKPGRLLLGGSIYDGAKIGVAEDRHMMTLATNRSGKGRACIIPNLLTWPGAAVVIDPKGQNAAVTAAARERLGQKVYIIDPFLELENIGSTLATHRWNPLAELDPRSLDFTDQIALLGDALVVSTAGSEFWDGSSQTILNGLIAHAITCPGLLPQQRTLGQVREWLTRKEGLPLADMFANTLTPLPAAAATAAGGDNNTTAGVMASVRQHTDWLDSVAMRAVFSQSTCPVRSIKENPATIFLVLPTVYLDTHGRFLRLFINTCMNVGIRGVKPKYDILFVLDEFYSLGRMQLLSKTAGAAAGNGVKLWPILQNLSQLQELYPKNWETFMGNAGMRQVFAINDQTTAKYIAESLGQHVRWEKQTVEGETAWVPQGLSMFRSPVDLAQETSRASGRGLIQLEGQDAMLLNRLNYDKLFHRSAYSPDPYQNRPTVDKPNP